MIVITGASSGIGLELAKLYKEAGKTVVSVSLHESEYADINFVHDLRLGSEIDKAAQEIDKLEEPFEVLVNCAGVYSNEPLGEITEDEIKRVMATNVKSAILMVSNLKDRIEKDETDIMNIASVAGTRPAPDELVYAASKWAIRGFSTSLQAKFKGKKNRVMTFCQGGTKTELFAKAGSDKSSDDTLMDPKEIAKAIKQCLDLPKNMEVSEIVINRKK